MCVCACVLYALCQYCLLLGQKHPLNVEDDIEALVDGRWVGAMTFDS